MTTGINGNSNTNVRNANQRPALQRSQSAPAPTETFDVETPSQQPAATWTGRAKKGYEALSGHTGEAFAAGITIGAGLGAAAMFGVGIWQTVEGALGNEMKFFNVGPTDDSKEQLKRGLISGLVGLVPGCAYKLTGAAMGAVAGAITVGTAKLAKTCIGG